MRQLINRSIRRKTLTIILMTSSVALLVSAIALLTYEARAYRAFLINDLTTQADILASVSAPSLAFEDAIAAEEALELLTNRSGIVAGAVYRSDGQLFATYQRAGEITEFPAEAGSTTPRVGDADLSLFHPVVRNDERLGTVYLKADYELGNRIRDYLLILAGAAVVSLVVAVLVSLWLQGSVTGPIMSIKNVAQKIVRERDFMLRAPKTTHDEIGLLADAFNTMLEEVSQRQRDLESSYQKLHEESEERRNAEAALRLSNKHKDEFLATLAHELRNPLAPMVNALTLMRSPKASSETSNNALGIMHRQLSQMSRLVEDLLDVSRISRGKLQVHKKTIPLIEIIRSAVDTVRPLLEAKEQELSLDVPDSGVLINADPVRLSQVLSNLLNNATKYTGPGGCIALSVAVEGDVVRIQVTDNGKGISARALPLIFMMFAQDEDSEMHSQSGLGVGLSLAKRLVELHGGMIYADSRGPGQGSTFTVQLPIERTQPATGVPQEENAPAVALARQRVLLVDDNVDFASSLSLLLRSLKHEVRVANDAPEALEALAEFEPDIAFLDIGLPTMDGFALARRMKEKTGGWIRLVAISGWGQDAYRRRAADAGFSTYLVKPVDLAEIRAILASQSSPADL
jgi:signal transduction histidine kinase/ActR/RegA family two-component response regulator